MTPAVKRCCIRALESTPKKIQRVLEEVRAKVWVWKSPMTIEFMPQKAEAFVTERMEALRRSGHVSEWKFELRQDSWDGYVAKIEYGYFPGKYSSIDFAPIKLAGADAVRL